MTRDGAAARADNVAPNTVTLCWAPAQDAPSTLFPMLAAAQAPLDELARVVATDRLSISAKVRLLEQWRYDLVQLQVGADDGLNCEPGDATLLQQLDRTLRLLDQRAGCH